MTKAQRTVLQRLWASWLYGPCTRDSDCKQLLDATLKESRDHDKFRGSHIGRGMSLTEEARWFALRRLCEYAIDGCREPSVKDYLHLHKSMFVACALAQGASTHDLVNSWAFAVRIDLVALAGWDYPTLIAVESDSQVQS